MSATRRAGKVRLPRIPAGRRASGSRRAPVPSVSERRAARARARDGRASAHRRGPRARVELGRLTAAVSAAVRRLGPARILIIVAVGLALGGGWLWFRDSSVVAVRRVTITGLSGPDAGRIRAALRAAARGMTTLDVQVARLHTAVQPFPAVRSLQVSSQFPDGLRIHVVEQLPAAVLTAAGSRLAVAADGTVLRDVRPLRSLPVIAIRALPVGTQLTGPQERQELAVLVAAPRPLRARIEAVSESALHGITVHLRRGPRLYFGTATELAAKWIAATAVLANQGSVGAVYIDVTDPQRPAAG